MLYTTSDITEFAPLVKPPAPAAAVAPIEAAAWSDDLRERLELAIEADPRLGRTWRKERASLNDDSDTGYAMALANALVAADWTDAEVVAGLRKWWSANSTKFKSASWYAHTAAKARGWEADGDAEPGSVGVTTTEQPAPQKPEPAPWPELHPDALYGLLGEIVREIEPHTEADHVAVLVHLLVACGAALNRGPHQRVEATIHPCNLFAALVGETSKGRKGTAWDLGRYLLNDADPRFIGDCVDSGVVSGEGIIWRVRDAVYETFVPKATAANPQPEPEQRLKDPGVDDKRLLIIEPELASVFKASARDSNTTSPTLRAAWDAGGVLRTMAKNSNTAATGAHISLIGHITETELRRLLDSTEIANGLANRVLWFLVRRSKLLPDGGRFLEEVDARYWSGRLRDALEQGRKISALRRDSQAADLWREVYPTLSCDRPGLIGAISNRAEAQALRISGLYAILDQSGLIREVHLRAALAVVAHSEMSVRRIWGDAFGDPVMDTIFDALRRAGDDGLSRNEIRDLFSRHQPAHAVSRALEQLQTWGRADVTRVPTKGRPREVWKVKALSALSAQAHDKTQSSTPYRMLMGG